MTAGDRIKQRREELGLSVADLASLLGKNRATVYRYESNYIEDLPTSVLEPLAQALDTTPAYIMGWVEGEEAPQDTDAYQVLSRGSRKLSEEQQKQLLEVARIMFKEAFGDER